MKRKFKHGELSSDINIGGINFGKELDPNVNLGSAVLCMSYKNLELDICIGIQITSFYSDHVCWYLKIITGILSHYRWICQHVFIN